MQIVLKENGDIRPTVRARARAKTIVIVVSVTFKVCRADNIQRDPQQDRVGWSRGWSPTNGTVPL